MVLSSKSYDVASQHRHERQEEGGGRKDAPILTPRLEESKVPIPTTTTTTTTTAINTAASAVSPVPTLTPSPAGKGLSVCVAAAFLVAEMSGSGVLALPRALANTGWAGVPLMVLLCLAVGFAGTRLGMCWVLLEERWPEYHRPCRRPYPAIARRALGKAGYGVAVVAQTLTLMGVSTVVLILAGDLLASLTAPLLTPCSCTGVVACLLTPASWLATPKDFWVASVAGVMVTVLQCVVVVVMTVVRGSSSDTTTITTTTTTTQPSLSSFFLGFGTILFSFGGASTFPTIQNDMVDRTRFPLSVAMAFFVLFGLYLPVAAVGYGVLGDTVPNNILLAVSGVAVTVVRVLLFVHLLFAFIILLNPVAQGLEDVLGVPLEFGWRRSAARTCLVAVEVLVSLVLPDFQAILNLVGGSTIAIMSFVLPPLCYLRLTAAKDPAGLPFRNVGIWERVVLWGVVVMGLAGSLVTTYTAASSLVSPAVLQRSCLF
ncbi:amino acid transporter AVT1J-like [Portunus trituberculatus]|uniref:amino acid transporter AVT1J-like n=1 Tax=Portunus trituberculatus TaxID=210409 RepID=UPI001E1CD958|nr:amino acid transporter AVT1J-like [Portunus trituberculatus]